MIFNRRLSREIQLITEFKSDIQRWFDDPRENPQASAELRSRINRNMAKVQRIIEEAGCMKTITLTPPPMIGGVVVRNGNPFSFVLESYYGMSMIPTVIDMIDATLGVLESPEYLEHLVKLSEEPVQSLKRSRRACSG